ncbi:hypothetical protein Tco_1067992 [Tanacetum coccineum]|uniref:Glutamic acid-rich protein-like n=1 Tax=Tanacetum coccineum TaxID=301880 RepID=A0ABQ5HF19_9ASTR
MGYEKLSQKLTFYKAFFSPQWKFLIHTILQCLSAKTTAWNEFSSTMASAIICLATNQKFNFSKYIFESMMKNLENVSSKFLMYLRFVQVFLEKQLEGMSNHKRIYVTLDTLSTKFLVYPRFLQVFLDKQLDKVPSYNAIFSAPCHTKKVFANMKRTGEDFSVKVTPLFDIILIQNQADMGEGSGQPTDPQHTPISDQPTITEQIIMQSSHQPKKTYKPRKPKRKVTQIPQFGEPIEPIADEVVLKERGDSLERAATTASSLEAKQVSGNIIKTRSKATLNEPNPQGTSSGSGPRCQDTMGDTIAQTRVLDLENTKTAQAQEITSLKLRVKKLEKKGGSRTHKLKRLYKVGRSVRVISSDEASLGDQEDASKQGRKIDDIDKDAEIILVDESQGRYGDDLMFEGQDVAEKEVSTVDPVTTAGEVVTTASVTTTNDDFTLAQVLMGIKNTTPKAKGVVIQEPGESTTIKPHQQLPSKDKGKGIMKEPEKPTKRKDQIRHDEEVAQRLQAQMQAKLEEEDRLVRQREEANIVSWDNVQAMIDADYQMAQQMQAKEQEKLSI